MALLNHPSVQVYIETPLEEFVSALTTLKFILFPFIALLYLELLYSRSAYSKGLASRSHSAGGMPASTNLKGWFWRRLGLEGVPRSRVPVKLLAASVTQAINTVGLICLFALWVPTLIDPFRFELECACDWGGARTHRLRRS